MEKTADQPQTHEENLVKACGSAANQEEDSENAWGRSRETMRIIRKTMRKIPQNHADHPHKHAEFPQKSAEYMYTSLIGIQYIGQDANSIVISRKAEKKLNFYCLKKPSKP